MPKITGLFASMEISSSGLAAQRRRMNTIAENLANTNTTHTDEGGPYRRKVVRFHEMNRSASLRGAVNREKMAVRTTDQGHISHDITQPFQRKFSAVKIDVVRDKADPDLVFDPEHPDADESGYVKMPKIDVITEMVDMISAARAYEANVTSIKVSKDMARRALDI